MQISEAKLKKLFKQHGSDQKVANELNVSHATIRAARLSLGLPSSREASKDRNAKIIEMSSSGKTGADIAKKLKVPAATVYYVISSSKSKSEKTAAKKTGKKSTTVVSPKKSSVKSKPVAKKTPTKKK